LQIPRYIIMKRISFLISVSVLLCSACGEEVVLVTTFTDSRDDNTYKQIILGDQVWMGENLNYDAGDVGWEYDDNSTYPSVYGRLYDWETAKDVCPDGWYLPSESEWIKLRDYLGGISVAAGKLKESGTTHWRSPNTGATNISGFKALPGGRRNTNGFYSDIGTFAFFWSSTKWPNGNTAAMALELGYATESFVSGPHHMDNGFSVRCIKD